MTGEKNIDEAFSIACGDFAGNVLFYKNGLLKEPVPVIAAGRMYRTPWTRDAAFNTWYAGALLCPSAAKNALLSVLSDKSGKLLIDEEFGQYWDIIIWVWGAWNYWLRTGDTEFLRSALEASENTLRLMRDWELLPPKSPQSFCTFLEELFEGKKISGPATPMIFLPFSS